MPNPRQMFDHALDAIKGYWEEYALDVQGTLHSSITSEVFAGSVLHISDIVTASTSGFTVEKQAGYATTNVRLVFKPGTPKVNNQAVMGLFLWQNSTDFDVANDGGDAWVGIIPARQPVLNCLVAKGAYELQSTEYDTTKTYVPNAYLYGNPTNGQLTTDSGNNARSVCGVVSQGVTTNYNEVSVLTFWPVFIG